jgi:hypothetical protein
MCEIVRNKITEKAIRLGLEIVWRSIEHVNDRYSEEEIKNLLDMLRSRHLYEHNLSYSWKHTGMHLTGLSMIPEACECFSDTLESMPLYINHPNPTTKLTKVTLWESRELTQ